MSNNIRVSVERVKNADAVYGRTVSTTFTSDESDLLLVQEVVARDLRIDLGSPVVDGIDPLCDGVRRRIFVAPGVPGLTVDIIDSQAHDIFAKKTVIHVSKNTPEESQQNIEHFQREFTPHNP